MMHRLNHIALLVIGAFLLTSSSHTHTRLPTPAVKYNHFAEWLEGNQRQAADNEMAAHSEIPDDINTISEYYEHPLTHQSVIDFFVAITASERIALPIIYHAEQYNVPIDLMFALSWVESSYRPYAVNHNRTSADRGLFQLNSKTFYHLDIDEFFHPDINALHAAQHLRYCLDKAKGDVPTALAIYNAGLGRVIRNTIPEITKVYRARIIEYRAQLVRQFYAYINRSVAADRTQHS